MKNLFSDFNQYFLDKRNRTIYYDSKKKVGYIVHEKDRVIVNFFHNRLTAGILSSALLLAYKINPVISVAVGILVYVGMDLMLKKRYLPSYTMLANYNIEKEKASIKENQKNPIWIIVLRLVLSIIFLGIVYYARKEQESYQTIALGIVGLYFLVTNIKELYTSYKD